MSLSKPVASTLPTKKKTKEWDHRRSCRDIRIFSDCEGIGSIIQASCLMQRRASARIKWSQVGHSELDDKVRAIWHENYHELPEVQGVQIWKSCIGRDMKQVAECDFYCNGFPCIHISPQGKRDADTNSETEDLIFAIVQFLSAKKPRAWMVENVPNLSRQFVVLLKTLVEAVHLACKNNFGENMYTIKMQILDMKLHGGLPQSRERLFIVGLERRYTTKQRAFKWPPTTQMQDIRSILDDDSLLPSSDQVWDRKRNNTTALSNFLGAMEEISRDQLDPDQCVADLGGGWNKKRHGGSSHNLAVGYSPCLTRTRCGQGMYYYFGKNRHHFLSSKELLRLQGFSSRFRRPRAVSSVRFNQCIGNAWPVTVVERLVSRIFVAVGLLQNEDVAEDTTSGSSKDLDLPFEIN